MLMPKLYLKNGKKLLVAKSDRFNPESKSLTSSSCALKIYFDNDSIFHSDLKLKYFDDDENYNFLTQSILLSENQ